MKLNINKIILAFATLFLVVNVLVAFDINFLYIRAILTFLFIIIVPGALIMLMMKIRNIGFWEYLVYTIGLSVAFIMFAGLAVNWILPWLHITDKPLSLWPILISFDIILLIFGFFAYRRNKDLELDVKPLELDMTNRIFFIIPMIFPVLSILGALNLNNFGSNILTMIMLGGIAVYVLFLVIFREKLNENVYPWAILLISISLLLSFSLRSQYIVGWDMSQEFYVFSITKSNMAWSINNFRDAYNACLSLTILPVVINSIINVSSQIIFKLVYQIIFGFFPLCIFLFSKEYLNRLNGFFATLIVIFTSGFFTEMPFLARQEIALLFFMLTILLYFKQYIISRKEKYLFLIFTFAMIVSHYTTSYISSLLFLLIFIFAILHKRYLVLRKKQNNRIRKISVTLLLVILLFAFLWYSQLTNTSGGLISTIQKSFVNIGSIFTKDFKDKQNLLKEQINPFSKSVNPASLLSNYTSNITFLYKNNSNFNLYEVKDYSNYTPSIVSGDILTPLFSNSFISYLNILGNFWVLIMKLIILIGALLFLIYDDKKNNEFNYISFGLLAIVTMLLVVPTLSNSYPLGRLFIQALSILSISAMYGCFYLIKKSNKFKLKWVIYLFILIYFFYSSGLESQFFGGSNVNLNLNNKGPFYEQYYNHANEIYSINWFTNKIQNNALFYSDEFASRKLIAFGGRFYGIKNLLPSIISKGAYVYLDYENVVKSTTIITLNGYNINFRLATDFLNKNKNKIYDNSASEIFK